MALRLNRRTFMAGTAAVTGAATFPMPSIAQNAPMKVGVLTPKTGVLAAGGIHNEEGITTFLKERDYTVAGRKIELIVADTGGNPAGAKTKAVELVERDKVNMIMGPFAAFEHLAIVDYLAQNKMPTFGYAGAEDVTQRKANPFIVRTTSSAAQSYYPMADYAFKELKVKRAVTMMDDFAFGYEQVGGFQRPFEELGGRVVKKLWAPLSTPDYTPLHLTDRGLRRRRRGPDRVEPAQVRQTDTRISACPCRWSAGSTFADDIITRSFGDEADRGLQRVFPIRSITTRRPTRASSPRSANTTAQDVADRFLFGGLLRERPDSGGGAQEDWRQVRRSGNVHQGGAIGRARPTRRAARSASTTTATSSATSLSAASERRTARWKTPS